MNELEFSPISEKNEESIDTVSFIYQPRDSNEKGKNPNLLGVTLNWILTNRLSYSMQLLKQFILFSSDQESIEADYRYMRHEVEGGVNKLQTSYGFLVKVVMGKAFQDIFMFSKKKEVYHNTDNLISLTTKYQRVEKQIKRESFNFFIKRLCQIYQYFRVESNQEKIKSEMSQSISNKHSSQEISKEDSRQVDIRSFEYISVEKEKSFSKSESQRHSENDSQKNRKKFIRMVNSSMITPISKKKPKIGDVSDTKKKSNYLYAQSQIEKEQLQQIYIVRQSKTSNKKVKKYLRIPITSHDVKIVEFSRETDEEENHGRFKEIYEDQLKERKKTALYESYGKKKFSQMKATHDCNGCKYCGLIEQMKEYREKRTINIYKY